MAMSDTVADLLTRIRNALAVGKKTVVMPASKFKVAIAEVLAEEGCIQSFAVEGEGVKKNLCITLRYHAGRPAVEELHRVSRPGRRVYRSAKDIEFFPDGRGVTIVSTPKGVMPGYKAQALGLGGEIICSLS